MPKFHTLDDAATKPTRGTAKSAGYDLHAFLPEMLDLHPGTTVLIQTGVTLELADNQWGEIKDRSGLSLKASLASGGGVIDADYYPKPIGVILHNVGNKVRTIQPGDRIAQLVIQDYIITHDDDANGERTGGFGSTGK